MNVFIGLSPLLSEQRYCSLGRRRPYEIRPDGHLIAIVSFLSGRLVYVGGMCTSRLTVLMFLVVLSPLYALAPARADDSDANHDRQEESDQRDQIRDLVQQGKLQPLGTLKAQILDKWPGDLIDVRVNSKNGAILYEFRILRAGGQVTEVEIDAASGRVIEVENE